MELDNLRIILLPNDLHDLNTVKVNSSPQQHDDDIEEDPMALEPCLVQISHPRTLEKALFIQDSKSCITYELKKVSGNNPHLNKSKLNKSQVLRTPDGQSIKSILIENQNDSNGVILSDPSIFVATKFNITYFLISFFQILNSRINDDSSIRYSSIEDIMDSLSSDINFNQLGNFPILMLEASLQLICDTITENGGDDCFYRFSKSKTLQFLTSKIDKISNSENFPVAIVHKIVNPSITPADIHSEIPTEISEIARLKSSIDLLSSYLLPCVVEELKLQYKGEFIKLREYQVLQMQKNDSKSVALQNLSDMNQLIQKSENDIFGGSLSKKKKLVTKDKKKQAVKIGKGALDRFFKRK